MLRVIAIIVKAINVIYVFILIYLYRGFLWRDQAAEGTEDFVQAEGILDKDWNILVNMPYDWNPQVDEATKFNPVTRDFTGQSRPGTNFNFNNF